MAVLSIITGQEQSILRTKTKKVTRVTREILKLVKDLEETTIASKGAGLAAPQVNRTERICVAMIARKLTPLINPEIIWKGPIMETAEEGCLSLPDVWLNITRPTEVIIRFMAANGKQRELKLQGFNARTVQHEIDHLDGVLIVDHVSTAPPSSAAHTTEPL